MKRRLLQAAAAIVAVALLFTSGTALAAPAVSAQSAVLMDAQTGRVLYAKDAETPERIASTTKIMTALLICERCDPDSPVRIPQEAVGIEGSSMYLQADEMLTVRELLYGLMLQSGNDAAVALAIYAAGTEEAFVGWMNDKAAFLGLKSTHFCNPNGLDAEGHGSTAHDMARLTAYAMENDLFREIVATKSVTVGQRCLTNHNKLLWRYDGAVGVKTGYTKQAGRILVSAAERDGRRLIAVTMNAPNDWQDHAALLDYGFETYTPAEILRAGDTLGAVPVLSGEKTVTSARAETGFTYPLLEGEEPEMALELPKFRFAPVEAGRRAGWAVIRLDGAEIGRVPLVWAETVNSKN